MDRSPWSCARARLSSRRMVLLVVLAAICATAVPAPSPANAAAREAAALWQAFPLHAGQQAKNRETASAELQRVSPAVPAWSEPGLLGVLIAVGLALVGGIVLTARPLMAGRAASPRPQREEPSRSRRPVRGPATRQRPPAGPERRAPGTGRPSAWRRRRLVVGLGAGAPSQTATEAGIPTSPRPPADRSASKLSLRLGIVLVFLTAAWYSTWLPGALDWSSPWLVGPFVAANYLAMASLLVGALNRWVMKVPARSTVPPGKEPRVAVVVPTAGEDTALLAATARSVLSQDWPLARLVVVVSDDASRPEVADFVRQLANEQRAVEFHYHVPPPRGSAERRGEAKAGNLNSVLRLLDEVAPDIAFVETRDVDDLVGDHSFLRETVGFLLSRPRTAFVQTVKTAHVSSGDPFDNVQAQFYGDNLRARYAANAVFPCGSGLVWRRAALDDIGGFPTWNLVEDFQSGVEVLARGWDTGYLPLSGAVGQHSPEDIPNVFKQRGTWALDTMRLLFWRGLKGLSVRQRLHFVEIGLFYALSFAMLVFFAMPVVQLSIGVQPIRAGVVDQVIHLGPYVAAIEIYVFLLFGTPRMVLRSREITFGLAPVFARACILALAYGRHRKPTYRVTRKRNAFAWYWRETLFHMLVVAALAGTLSYSLWTGTFFRNATLLTGYWACFFGFFIVAFIRKGWYGVGGRGEPEGDAADGHPDPGLSWSRLLQERGWPALAREQASHLDFASRRPASRGQASDGRAEAL